MVLNRLCHIIPGIVIALLHFGNSGKAQSFFESSDTFHAPRFRGVVIGTSTAYTATLVGLNELWYKQYPRSSFHFIKDRDEWLQMDKFGHVVGAYYESYAFYRLLNWSGVPRKKRVWYGGLAGFVLQTPIEVFDGFSEGWGASPGDIVANALGSGAFIAQEKLWGEQKIRFKYSFSSSGFAHERPDLLGENFLQQTLKDYNGQTYWMSMAVNEFIPNNDPLPRWLDVSVGYGGDGMLGGKRNPEEYSQISRYRQYYFSMDVNTAAIDTKSKFWNTFLHALSFIKFPAPAVEYNGENGFRWHYLHF